MSSAVRGPGHRAARVIALSALLTSHVVILQAPSATVDIPLPAPEEEPCASSSSSSSCLSALWEALVGLSECVLESLRKAWDLGRWAFDAALAALGIVIEPTATKGQSQTDVEAGVADALGA
jgi:hypothetical protein